MSIKYDKVKFDNMKMELSVDDFNRDFDTNENGEKVELAMTVDASAEYTTNANEYFRRAMIGENSSRAKFRQVLGVKDRIKLGTAIFDSLIKPGATNFDPTDSTISQKDFEVTPLMVGTSVIVSDLETAFMSDQIAKGSVNFNDKFAFMNFFYETLSKSHMEEMEILTYRGNKLATPVAGSEYLNAVDGLEYLLDNDADVLVPTTSSAVTSANIIDKLIEARNALPIGVKTKPDFHFQLSINAYEAYIDAINENQASGQYFNDSIVPNFQGVEIHRADGASDNTIIAGGWSNFLNLQDLITDETGYEVVDFFKTQLSRKIGVRTDFKFQPSYVLGKEIYFHTA